MSNNRDLTIQNIYPVQIFVFKLYFILRLLNYVSEILVLNNKITSYMELILYIIHILPVIYENKMLIKVQTLIKIIIKNNKHNISYN